MLITMAFIITSGCYAATSHDNLVAFKDVTIKKFDMYGYSITAGQPWEGYHIDDTNNGIVIKAGREGDFSNGKWLLRNGYSDYDHLSTTNFAFAGEMTFFYQDSSTSQPVSYSCPDVAFAQASVGLIYYHDDPLHAPDIVFRNVWFMIAGSDDYVSFVNYHKMKLTCSREIDGAPSEFIVTPEGIFDPNHYVNLPVNSFVIYKSE